RSGVIGAWGWVLLQQGQQFEQSVPGEFCAPALGVVRGPIGRQDGNAKPQRTLIGHHDMAGALGGMAHRQDLEASTVEGMGGVGHLDHFGIELRWVLDGGIMLLSRLTTSITRSCCQSSTRKSTITASSGCWTACSRPDMSRNGIDAPR